MHKQANGKEYIQAQLHLYPDKIKFLFMTETAAFEDVNVKNSIKFKKKIIFCH